MIKIQLNLSFIVIVYNIKKTIDWNQLKVDFFATL